MIYKTRLVVAVLAAAAAAALTAAAPLRASRHEHQSATFARAGSHSEASQELPRRTGIFLAGHRHHGRNEPAELAPPVPEPALDLTILAGPDGPAGAGPPPDLVLETGAEFDEVTIIGAEIERAMVEAVVQAGLTGLGAGSELSVDGSTFDAELALAAELAARLASPSIPISSVQHPPILSIRPPLRPHPPADPVLPGEAHDGAAILGTLDTGKSTTSAGTGTGTAAVIVDPPRHPPCLCPACELPGEAELVGDACCQVCANGTRQNPDDGHHHGLPAETTLPPSTHRSTTKKNTHRTPPPRTPTPDPHTHKVNASTSVTTTTVAASTTVAAASTAAAAAAVNRTIAITPKGPVADTTTAAMSSAAPVAPATEGAVGVAVQKVDGLQHQQQQHAAPSAGSPGTGGRLSTLAVIGLGAGAVLLLGASVGAMLEMRRRKNDNGTGGLSINNGDIVW